MAAAEVTGPDRLRQRLADARLYLCTDARQRQGDLPEFLDEVLAGGVDIVQLRHKDPEPLEAAQELATLDLMATVCRRHGALLAVNDRVDVAHAAGSDIVHLGQDDLPVDAARRIIGAGPVIGRSSHAPGEVDTVIAEAGSDYFCVGPCWPTPTKPGRPAPGLDLVRYAARTCPPDGKPWFAIGGIDQHTLDPVLEAGARRVVVVRAITEADDPGAAARELARRLRAAG